MTYSVEIWLKPAQGAKPSSCKTSWLSSILMARSHSHGPKLSSEAAADPEGCEALGEQGRWRMPEHQHVSGVGRGPRTWRGGRAHPHPPPKDLFSGVVGVRGQSEVLRVAECRKRAQILRVLTAGSPGPRFWGWQGSGSSCRGADHLESRAWRSGLSASSPAWLMQGGGAVWGGGNR